MVLTRNADGTYPMSFYFEPNSSIYYRLKAMALKNRSMGWGFTPLKYINRFATLPLFDFFNQFNWNYGLIILALTVGA